VGLLLSRLDVALRLTPLAGWMRWIPMTEKSEFP
jgi:hypothetical protein